MSDFWGGSQSRYCEPEHVWQDPDFIRYCNGEIERKPEWGITKIDIPSWSELVDPANANKVYRDGEWHEKE